MRKRVVSITLELETGAPLKKLASRDYWKRILDFAPSADEHDVRQVTASVQQLKPSFSLLVKLGSIAVHADEMNDYGFDQTQHGYEHDRAALVTLLEDPEVTDWCAAMTKMAMLPEKR